MKEIKKILLLITLIISGMSDSMANIFDHLGSTSNKDTYLLVTFVTALVLALIWALVKKERINKVDIIYGLAIGIPNYFSARFLLQALSYMEAIVVYPSYSVITLISITITGFIVFKEQLSKKKIFALILIMISIGLLNI